MKRKMIFTAFFIFNILVVLGQSSVQKENAHKVVAKQMESPEIASMNRYGNYPVNLSVGLPNIDIPIYTIKSGQLEHPITLSYHMSGNRVEDISSWVGLGWSLNVGGAVVRTLNGAPDEGDGGFLKTTKRVFYDSKKNKINCVIPLTNTLFSKVSDIGIEAYGEMKLYLESSKSNYLDSESDTYNYSVGGINGSFVYNLAREIVQTPNSDNKIIRDANNNILIVSDKGIRYKFNASDAEYYTNQNGGIDMRHISNWRISEIVSADLLDSIQFVYSPTLDSYTERRNSYIVSEGARPDGKTDSKKCESIGYSSISEERLLQTVIFKNGQVDFIPSREKRKDKRNHKLEEIVIRNSNKEVMNRVVFDHDYFISRKNPIENVDYRLKLNSINIWGNNAFKPLNYKFRYNTTMLPPYNMSSSIVGIDNNLVNGQDYWGYYNGIQNNKHLVGMIEKSSLSYSEKANRNPSEGYMKACILTQIIYPTGGNSVFEMEANRDSLNQIVGGLRIREMVSNGNDGSSPIIFSYKYENIANVYRPVYEQYKYKMYQIGYGGNGPSVVNQPRTFYTENPLSSVGYYSGSPVLYRKVTKIEKGNGRTIYTYDSPSSHTYKMHCLTSYYGADPQRSYTSVPHPWATGNLLKEEVFRENSSIPTRSVVYTYDTETSPVFDVGILVLNRFIPYDSDNRFDPTISYAKDLYEVYNKEYKTGYKILTSQTEIEDGVTKVTKFVYENSRLEKPGRMLLTQKVTSSNNGDVIIKKYTYPINYPNIPVYKDMISKNMISIPIETTTLKNNVIISKVKRNFDYFPKIRPANDQSSTGNTPYKTNVVYDKYDKQGNLQQYTTSDDISTTLLWGYNYQYPVAEIKNATYTELISLLDIGKLQELAAKDKPSSNHNKTLNYLRAKLPSAQILSYSYQPLIGMLSSTDASGITTYYDYDSFGRLRRIYLYENGVRNILKDYNYNYKGGSGTSSSQDEYNAEIIENEPGNDFSLSFDNQNYYVLKNSNLEVNIRGGSGYYTYIWTLKNSSGKQLAMGTAETLKYTFGEAGKNTLTCSVTDIFLKTTKTITKTIDVVKENLDFTSRKQWLNQSNDIYYIEGDLEILSHAAIEFECEMIASGRTNRNSSFTINGQRINLSGSCANSSPQGRCVTKQKIYLPKGIYTITGELSRREPSSSDYCQIIIRMKTIESSSQMISDSPQMGGRN